MTTKPTLSAISKIYGITIKEIKTVVDKHHFSTLDNMDIIKIIDTFGSNEEVSNLITDVEEIIEDVETVEETVEVEEVVETIEIEEDDLLVDNMKPDWCSDIQWLMFNTGIYDMDINPDKE